MSGFRPLKMAKRATSLRSGRARLVVAAVVILATAASAWAYFGSTGTGTAAASVGVLAAPTGVAGTPGTGSVALSWNAITPPASGTVTYYVTRSGGTPGGNCPTSASPSTATSCTDSGLDAGSYQYTVTAVWQSWTTTSSTISVSVATGALDHFLVSAPATAAAGAAFNITITAEDDRSNTVTSYTGTQTLTFSGPDNSPDGNVPTFPATVSFSNGVGTASIDLFDAETAKVQVAQGSVQGQSPSIVVSGAGAASLSVSTPGTQTAGSAFNETLTALDGYGNTATGYIGSRAVSFTGPASSPAGTVPSYPATVSFSGGVGTASVTLYDAQSTSLGATQGSLAGTSGSFSVSAASAASFVVGSPGTQTAGSPFNETLTALDGYGNTATGYTGSQALAFTGPANSPGGTAPIYPAAVTFSSGAGTASITLYDAQTTTLSVIQGSLMGSSSSFTVSAAGAVSFAVGSPGTRTAGTAFNVTLTALDSYANTAVSYGGAKALSFSGPASSPGGTAPSYPATVTFSSGVGTASITLYDAQSTSIGATQGSMVGASGSFSVSAASAASFAVGTPGTQTAGTAFNVTLTALDSYANTAVTYGGAKAISFSGPASSPGGTAPSYPATVTFSGGIGTASITLYDAQTTTVTATQSGLTGACGSFSVSAASAASFAAGSPGTQTAGTAFNVTLTALDIYANTAAAYGGAKAISFSGPASSPGGTAPTYPASVTFSNGAGTASITLYDAQTTTLTATQSGLTGTSVSFSVSAASAASFAVGSPGAQTAGAAFNETLTALDSYGNTAAGYAGSKTIAFTGPASSPGGTGPAYPASVTFSNGAGTGSITLYDAQTTTLTATQGSIGGTSGSFTVSPLAATQLAFTTQPAGANAGVAFTTQPVVTAEDTYRNTVASYSKTVTLSIKSGTGTSGATLSGCTSSRTNGVTTFSGCQISQAGTGYQLNGTDGTLTATSAAFTVTTTVTKTVPGTYTLTVPAGVTSFNFATNGAGGGGGQSAAGGAGGTVSGTVTLPSSASATTFTVVIGGAGGGGSSSAGGAGGVSGTGCALGGAGGVGHGGNKPDTGGGGGGATCVYLQGAPANVVLVAGGGGGGGAISSSASGGAGGGGPASNPATNTAASGGTSGTGTTGGGGGLSTTTGSFPFTLSLTAGTAGTGANATAGGTCSGGTCGAGGVGAAPTAAGDGGGGGGGGIASGGGGGGGTNSGGGGGGSAYTGGTKNGSASYTVTVGSASNGGGGGGGVAAGAGTAGSVTFTGVGLTLA